MTTVTDVLRTAEEVRAEGLIYREPSGYVSIQEMTPFSPADGNHRFPRGVRIEHCGVSVGFVLTRAGFRFGIDYPPDIQYTPSLAAQIYSSMPEQWAPGAIGVIDWAAAGYGTGWASDHAVLIMRTEGEWAWTWETNTTPDGKPYYYKRHYSLFTAVGMPPYSPEPDTPTIDRQAARLGGFATNLIGA